MQNNKQNRLTTTKKIATLGLMTALSVTIGWICKTYFTFDAIRITFENIPIILSGIFYGPIAGAVVAAISDIISCISSPNPQLNPIITLGAISIGVISGIFSKHILRKRSLLNISATVCLSHFIGSVLIKSFGLWLFWRYPLPVLIFRIPTYILISVCETTIIYLIMKNDSLVSLFNKKRDKNERKR